MIICRAWQSWRRSVELWLAWAVSGSIGGMGLRGGGGFTGDFSGVKANWTGVSATG